MIGAGGSAGGEVEAEVRADLLDGLLGDPGGGGELGPALDRGGYLGENPAGGALFQPRCRRRLVEVGDGEVVAPAVDRHLVDPGPTAFGVEGVDDVEGRGERPLAAAVHQEGDVLDVVVLVTGDDVEDHPPNCASAV